MKTEEYHTSKKSYIERRFGKKKYLQRVIFQHITFFLCTQLVLITIHSKYKFYICYITSLA